MDRTLIDRIARAVLYEGYLLYPYRRSSLKNQGRWTFGTLYPPAWTASQIGSDRSDFRMECLLRGDEASRLSVLVRFLQVADAAAEAVEQEVPLEVIVGEILKHERRREWIFGTVCGAMALGAAKISAGLFRFSLMVSNQSDFRERDRDETLPHSLLSAHAAISVTGGRFVSVIDPQEEFKAEAAALRNAGVWPVLIGAPGATDTMLAAPIILPDYPEVAPESAGDLYDATEIEEILTLRILTLSDEEKAEVRGSEERARRILERAENVPAEHLLRLHGTIRGLAPTARERWSAWDTEANAPPQTVRVKGAELKAGDRVRLRPKAGGPNARADIFDSALDGRIAWIEAIELDFEDRIHLAVVLEDDPGRDLGEMRHIGHRFFFSLAEVEPLTGETKPEETLL